jgi:hypothetical protein
MWRRVKLLIPIGVREEFVVYRGLTYRLAGISGEEEEEDTLGISGEY